MARVLTGVSSQLSKDNANLIKQIEKDTIDSNVNNRRINNIVQVGLYNIPSEESRIRVLKRIIT